MKGRKMIEGSIAGTCSRSSSSGREAAAAAAGRTEAGDMQPRTATRVRDTRLKAVAESFEGERRLISHTHRESTEIKDGAATAASEQRAADTKTQSYEERQGNGRREIRVRKQGSPLNSRCSIIPLSSLHPPRVCVRKQPIPDPVRSLPLDGQRRTGRQD